MSAATTATQSEAGDAIVGGAVEHDVEFAGANDPGSLAVDDIGTAFRGVIVEPLQPRPSTSVEDRRDGPTTHHPPTGESDA